jgi:hypothetical protein
LDDSGAIIFFVLLSDGLESKQQSIENVLHVCSLEMQLVIEDDSLQG